MKTTEYTLREVADRRTERQFLDLPKRLYKNEKNWICPLDDDVREVFDPTRNELFADGEAIRWIALDGRGRVVGRIAAFYNREKAAIEEQPTGGCGFFESIDDQSVADLLFDAAREWLEGKGMEAMDGPVNFGQRRDWWGLLVEGFEYTPLYKNPYNFPYYKKLMETYGFQNWFNQNSYIYRVSSDAANRVIFERSQRLLSTPGYRVAPIDMTQPEKAAEDFRTVYNKAWASFPGVRPMDREEALEMMETIRPIIDPHLIYFTFHNDEPVGFFVGVPDLNCIIGRFNGRFGLWQKLRLLWGLKVAKSCDRIFGIIFGVAPEYHGKGIESVMIVKYHEYLEQSKSPYNTLELAWIGDFNPVMNRMITHYVGAVKHKMHTTYRYLFDRTKPFHRCPSLLPARRRPAQEQAPDKNNLKL